MTVEQTLNEVKEEEITPLVDLVSVSSNQKQALTVTLLYLGEHFPTPAVSYSHMTPLLKIVV